MQTTDIPTVAAAAVAMGVLLINSCTMFFSLLKERETDGVCPSIRIHLLTTLVLIGAVVLLLMGSAFSWGWAVRVSFGIAAGAILLTIPCAFLLASNLGTLGENMKKATMRWSQRVPFLVSRNSNGQWAGTCAEGAPPKPGAEAPT